RGVGRRNRGEDYRTRVRVSGWACLTDGVGRYSGAVQPSARGSVSAERLDDRRKSALALSLLIFSGRCSSADGGPCSSVREPEGAAYRACAAAGMTFETTCYSVEIPDRQSIRYRDTRSIEHILAVGLSDGKS